MRNECLTYRPVQIDDAEMILRWRTEPAIARYMMTEIESSLDKQRQWIETANQQPGFVHRLIRVNEADVGYCSIKTVDPTARVATIGVYIGEASAPRALTAFNFIHILNHAYFGLDHRKIVNHILATNERILAAQKFNGYYHVGVLPEHVVKGGARIDTHIFEQTAEQWATFRLKFGDWRDLDGGFWPPSSAGPIAAPGKRR